MGDKMDEVKGRAKKAAGEATDDDELKREGEVDRKAAKAKDKAGDAVDAVRDKVNDVFDK